ncbi:RIP metalloprotease RseP [soil metagenome]
MAILLLIVSLVLFVGLVVVHELGHFIVARRNGVEAEEFGIGFPPRVWKKRIKSKRGDFDFSINLLPLGGFVKLKGEHDTDTERGSFGAASVWVKTKIMVAGVAMNFVTAFVLLIIVALVGMPKLVENQFTVAKDTKTTKNDVYVGYVEPKSPAAKAGLVATDRLIGYKVAGTNKLHVFATAGQLPKVTDKYAGQTVTFVLERNRSEIQKKVTLRSDAEIAASLKTENPKGHLGIAPSELTLRRSTWSAPIVAGGLMWQFTSLTMQGLGHALAGLGGIIAGALTGNTPARQAAQTEASSQVSGPVGIYFILKSGSILGYQYVLFVIAIISLTLAIMNFLPIPALDGGRMWLTLISRAFKRPLSQKTEELVNATGFLLLIGLIILISVVDVRRFF